MQGQRAIAARGSAMKADAALCVVGEEHLKTSNTRRWEAVLQCSGEGIEQDALGGSLREVGGEVAQQDGCVGSDGRLLVHLTHTHVTQNPPLSHSERASVSAQVSQGLSRTDVPFATGPAIQSRMHGRVACCLDLVKKELQTQIEVVAPHACLSESRATHVQLTH